MDVACASHALCIFNLNTEISLFTDYSYITIFTHYLMPHPTQPLAHRTPCLLTWRTSFFACGGEYPFTLVPGLLTTAPPFASLPTLSHPTDQVTVQYVFT